MTRVTVGAGFFFYFSFFRLLFISVDNEHHNGIQIHLHAKSTHTGNENIGGYVLAEKNEESRTASRNVNISPSTCAATTEENTLPDTCNANAVSGSIHTCIYGS